MVFVNFWWSFFIKCWRWCFEIGFSVLKGLFIKIIFGLVVMVCKILICCCLFFESVVGLWCRYFLGFSWIFFNSLMVCFLCCFLGYFFILGINLIFFVMVKLGNKVICWRI